LVLRIVILLSVALVLAAPVRGQARTGEPVLALAGAHIIELHVRNISDDPNIGDGSSTSGAAQEPAQSSATERPPSEMATTDDSGAGQPTGDRNQRLLLVWDVAGDIKRFFTTRETYVILGLGLTGSVLVMPFDDDIRNSRLDARVHHESTRLDKVFKAGHYIGSSNFQIGIALATYGIGSWTGTPGVAHLGRDLFRAQLLTAGVTQLVKHSVGRRRPDGFSQTSFPSGHASGTFASATVLHRYYGWKVGIPAFGVASYVSLSRVADNQHFLSDIVFGAAIGLTVGRTVTFDRGATRVEVSPVAVPGGAGVRVSVFKVF